MVWWILLVALLLVGGSPGRVPVPVVLDASFERGVRGQYRGTVEASGNVLTIRSSNPGGTDLTYDWTALNQLKSVTDARVSATPTTYEYDAEGNLDKVSYANGVLNDYGADARRRIKTLASTWNGSARGQFSYTFDAAGLRASVQELGGRTAAYEYDGLNRLTRETVSGDASGSNGVLDYGLDETGNRLARAGVLGNLGPQSFTYNGNDQISGSAFDPNGNVTAAGGNSYHYTFENRLSGLNSGQVQYVHDGDGHRVRKIKGGVTTYYLVDEVNPTGYAQVLEELAAPNTTPAKLYGYGSDLISLKQGSSVFFYGYDAQGTVRYLTGGTAGSSYGQVTDTYTYDAFGNLIHRQARRTSDGALISFAAPALESPPAGTQPADNWHRQYGEHWDPDLGMVYLRARYDHPGTARFWTMDTFEGSQTEPLSLHKYLYCAADPVNRLDPNGYFSTPEFNISAAISESLQAFRAAPQGVIKQAVKQYAKNIAEAFDFRDQDENRQLSQAAERLWTMRLQLHGFKVVNLASFGQKGPDLVAFGKSGGRYHLIVGEVKGTRRARVMSMLDQLEDRTIQMSANWIQMGLESILDGVMGMLPDLSQYAGGRLSALLDRGEFDLYLLRARDMRNNSWVLTGYPLLQVNLPGGGGKGKGVTAIPQRPKRNGWIDSSFTATRRV